MRKNRPLAFFAVCWLVSFAPARGDEKSGAAAIDSFDELVEEPAAPPAPRPRSRKKGGTPPAAPQEPVADTREDVPARREETVKREETVRREEPARTPTAPPPPAQPAPETAASRPAGEGGVPVGRAVAERAAAPDAKPLPRQLVESVSARLAGGDHEGAALQVRQALKAEPENERLRELEKLLARRVSSPSDGQALARKAASLMESRPDAGAAPAASLASPLAWPGAGADPAAAARAAAAVPGASSDFLKRDLSQQGLLKMGLKDYSAAESALTMRILQDPNDWVALRLRAMTRRSMKKPEAALEDAAQALRINPRDGWSHNVRALAQSDLGRYREAVREADLALALNGRDANALAARAMAKDKMGRPGESLADLKAASELDPQFAALYQQALGTQQGSPGSAPRSRPWSGRAVQGAAGLLLLAAAAFVYRRRTGFTTARPVTGEAPSAMRAQDRFAAGQVDAPRDEARGYRILRELGHGGMGVVYEALDETLQRTVALKRLRDDLAADASGRRRFLKEARLVASLKHPHIVEIHSVLEQGQGLFLIFEYVPGQSLEQVLGARRLSPAEVLGIARQAASALDYAHGQGVTHQDFKPANVLVSGGLVKVTDFGIARRLTDATTTMHPLAMGTPAYMAPEQARGLHDKASDVYALGLCVYEMLTQARPFHDDRTFARRLAREFTPASELVRGLSRELDAAFERVLDPEPARRHPTATAFADELARLLPHA